MLEMAQEMFKAIQDRFRTTLRVMADLAESVGVPPTVTTLLTGKERAECCGHDESWTSVRERGSAPQSDVAVDHRRSEQTVREARPAKASRPAAQTPDQVRGLRVDDEVNGSTYLARIIWSLGVSDLEGSGPLRPADMARMIMSRSPVSLEPPNVARYIRRSKPTCIEVARTEGSSSFYALNDEGKTLFARLFRDEK